jgi:hypothetical protein
MEARLLTPLPWLRLLSDCNQDRRFRISAAFYFRTSFYNDSLPTGWVNGVQTLADYDNDGDLDMTVGSMPKGLFLFANNDTAWATVKIGMCHIQALELLR